VLAILTTHPIQYQVPLWQALARDGRVPFEVWYLCDHAVRATADPEFGRTFAWDLGRGSLEGYPHRFLRTNPRRSLRPADFFGLRLQEPLAPLFQEKNVSALWIQGWQKLAYWQAVAQAKSAGVEVWLRGETNDLAPPGGGLRRWLKRTRLRWLFSRVDRFLCIGTANRRFYTQHGVPAARMFASPYGVDHARFAVQASALRSRRAEIRAQWGIADDAFCVLFCGKFIPKKRPFDLVQASVQLARSDAAAVHLLFVGSGVLGGDLRRACDVVFDAETAARSPAQSDGSLRPRASFAGFLNQVEISRAYVAADALVLPSDHGETWGLVVNEAMASGLPCALSDVVGCGEDLVAPVDAALRFPLGDTAGLAEALTRVRRKPPAVDALARVVGGHDFDVTIATVRAICALSDAEKETIRPAGLPVVAGALGGNMSPESGDRQPLPLAVGSSKHKNLP
jgi:glycosyltransferase involved in cell wall biosynthesis